MQGAAFAESPVDLALKLAPLPSLLPPQDNWVKGGEQVVRLNVRGEKFDTVMAAISSHPGTALLALPPLPPLLFSWR